MQLDDFRNFDLIGSYSHQSNQENYINRQQLITGVFITKVR